MFARCLTWGRCSGQDHEWSIWRPESISRRPRGWRGAIHEKGPAEAMEPRLCKVDKLPTTFLR